jgi:flagellin-like hook-associated protein FlgL
MSDISLTSAQRSSLLSLQRTASLSERTQNRLTTGQEVNNVVDDAVKFFQAKSLSDRASDFDLRKSGIDQGLSTLNATLAAVEAIDSFLGQLKGVAQAAKSQSTNERISSTAQFDEIGEQIYQLIEDASYQGVNLLNATGNTLDVAFGVRTASELSVSGLNLNATAADTSNGLFSVAAFSSGGAFDISGGFGLSGGSFTSLGAANSNVAAADTVIQTIDEAVSRLRGQAAELGSNVAILQTRLNFTDDYVNELTIGSDKLTLADLNEEGANLSALQTRQQIGIQSLAIAGQQQQAILSLLQ